MLMSRDRVLKTLRPDVASFADRQRLRRATSRLRIEQFDRFPATCALTNPRPRFGRSGRQVVHDAAGYFMFDAIGDRRFLDAV